MMDDPYQNYGITDLETLAVVWANSHFHAYLYDHDVTVYTNKHARWWMKVYSRGVKTVSLVYRDGKENTNVDTLSCSPYFPAPTEGIAETDVQVAVVQSSEGGPGVIETPSLSDLNTEELLRLKPGTEAPCIPADLGVHQRMDPEISEIFRFLQQEELPTDEKRARKIAAQGPLFVIVDNIPYYLDPKRGDSKRAVVPI